MQSFYLNSHLYTFIITVLLFFPKLTFSQRKLSTVSITSCIQFANAGYIRVTPYVRKKTGDLFVYANHETNSYRYIYSLKGNTGRYFFYDPYTSENIKNNDFTPIKKISTDLSRSDQDVIKSIIIQNNINDDIYLLTINKNVNDYIQINNIKTGTSKNMIVKDFTGFGNTQNDCLPSLFEIYDKNQNKYFYFNCFLNNFYLKIQKYEFIDDDPNNKNLIIEKTATNSYKLLNDNVNTMIIINCFLINDNKNIHCFYISENGYISVAIFYSDNINKIDTAKIIDNTISISSNSIFIKSINIKNNIIAYIYFKDYDPSTFYADNLNLMLKEIKINENLNTVNIDDYNDLINDIYILNTRNTFDTLIAIDNFNDFIKLSDNQFCYLNNVFGVLSIIKFTLYENDSILDIKYFKWDLSTNFIPLNIELFSFQNFLGFSFYIFDSNGKTVPKIMISSYANSTDIIENNIQTNNYQITLKNYISIENNIFGLEIYGIKIINLPNKTSGITFFNPNDNKRVEKNDIIKNNGLIELIVSYDLVSNNDPSFNKIYTIEFQGILSEPENFNDYNNTSDLSELILINNVREFNHRNFYKGRIGLYNFTINNNIQIKLCHENCISCTEQSNLDEDQKCLFCKEEFDEIEYATTFLGQNINLYNCYTKCPENYIRNNITLLCENIIDKNSKNYEVLQDIIKNIDQYSDPENIIKLDKMFIQVYSTNDEDLDKANEKAKENFLTTIEMKECINKIVNYYNYSSANELKIIKIDFNSTNGISNNIEFFIFDSNGKELDTSICDDSSIIIKKPINDNENIDLETAKYYSEKYGIDVYNSSEEEFNDICTQFTSQNNTDVIIKNRREDYYQNVSFCEKNSVYLGVNYSDYTAICSYSSTENKSYELFLQALEYKNSSCSCGNKTLDNIMNNYDLENNVKNEFLSTLYSSNYHIIKCYKLVFKFKIIIKNIGGWTILVLLIIQIIFFIIFMKEKLNPVKNFIKNFNKELIKRKIIKKPDDEDDKLIIKNNPPKKKNSHTTINQFNKHEIKMQGFLIDDDGAISNTTEKSNKRIVKKNSNIDNVLLVSPIKTKSKFRSENKINNIGRINRRRSINVLTSTIQSENFQSKGNKKRVLSNIQNIDTNNNFDTKKEKNSSIIDKYENTDEKISDLSFYEAVKSDKRNIFQIYKGYLIDAHILINLFFSPNYLELRYIKFIFFIFGLGFDGFLNAFFYDISIIENTYEVGGFDFFTEFPKTIYSTILTIIITFFINFLTNQKDKLAELIEEYRTLPNYKQKLKDALKCLKIKLVLFFIINILLMLFFWYYCSCFGAVYVNSSKYWLFGMFESIIMGLLIPFIFTFITSLLRWISLKYELEWMYSITKIMAFFH